MKRAWLAIGIVAWGAAAQAGVMGGFAGHDAAYLVGADKVCAPIAVENGVAKGTPTCHKAASDELAQLSIKPAKAERGTKAQFAATASGGTLTVTRPDSGATVVTWTSLDPISKVVDVYASSYGNLVAVEVMVRRAGRDQADVIAFELGAPTAPTPTGDTHATPTAPAGDPTPTTPALTKALAAARKAKGKAALAAWQKVLTLDADNSEARYGTAVAQAGAKSTADALATLATLAASKRADAIEFLVAARFDKAFAALRADAAFRKSVGLDRPAATFYERLMGMGGTWEQAGTSCDTPQVTLVLTRDRAFTLRVKSACEGDRYDDRFAGTWAAQDPQLVLSLPNPDGHADDFPCAVEPVGGEDSVHCAISEGLEFSVRPVRR